MLPRMDDHDEVPLAARLERGADVFRVQTTRPDGSADTVEVIKTDAGYRTRARRTSERAAAVVRAAEDPMALVREALVVDAVTSIRITPAAWGPASADVLAALRIDLSALDGEQGDDRFDVAVDGLEERIVAVPCWVGDSHVAGLVHEGRVVPVLLDDDDEGLAGEELARYTWFSGSGGAPVSWDGGAALLRVNGPLGLTHSWGDGAFPASLVEVPVEPQRLAELIAGWLGYDQGSLIGAALAYAPFDPDGSLSAQERAR